jgi:endothelin-converting enzyme/putative endopeptidase
MRIETALAKGSMTRVERRDPNKLYHKMSRAELAALSPSFNWERYFSGVGLAPVGSLNVAVPDFFKQMDALLKAEDLAALKTYLRWHLVHANARYLSSPFVAEQFNFYEKTLTGAREQQPRWKRCVRFVDRDLGEALGQAYVEKRFGPADKERALKMVREIEQAMERDLDQLAWMSPATKKQALEKLHAMRNKIGYPDKWRDYSNLKIARGDALGNFQRSIAFEFQRNLHKIGQPLDRGEWLISPSTVNAYYNPQMNDINFPAGVLQPPLFDPKMDDAPNYGNTGGTIGHELTHAFDDEGRQFDAHGNLKDWWTKKDAKEFNQRAQCIVDQYAQYVVVDDIKINSKLTLGEDVADLGGLILGWMAWQAQMASMPAQAAGLLDGFTPEQRFFVGYAQWACENDQPENLRVNLRSAIMQKCQQAKKTGPQKV